MRYDPDRPKIVVRINMQGTYNVVEEKRGRSGRILASFPSKEQAEAYKEKRRP